MKKSLPTIVPWFLATSALASAGTGCVHEVEDPDDHAYDDVVHGDDASESMQGLARAGRWELPANVASAGDKQEVSYDGAPPYDGGTNCSGGATSGATMLRDHLLRDFPQIRSIGIYNCRVIAGTNSMSLHGVGRALDIMLPTTGGDADNGLGDPIANWLVENAEAMGVQTVIWDRTIWSVSRTPRAREYTGVSPHVDHLHVELNIAASRRDAPWFRAPFGPEACERLPRIEPGSPAVVDEEHGCFAMFGPANRWHAEDDGHRGGLLWTRVLEQNTRTNWARWSLPLRHAGRFEVQVFVDPAWGEWGQTKYKVKTGTGEHVVLLDQGSADGWTTLGTFDFAADGSESVVVVDTAADVSGTERRIVVDGLRVRVPRE